MSSSNNSFFAPGWLFYWIAFQLPFRNDVTHCFLLCLWVMKIMLCQKIGILVEFVGEDDVHGRNVVLSDYLVVDTLLFSWNWPVEYVKLTPFGLNDMSQVHGLALFSTAVPAFFVFTRALYIFLVWLYLIWLWLKTVDGRPVTSPPFLFSNPFHLLLFICPFLFVELDHVKMTADLLVNFLHFYIAFL